MLEEKYASTFKLVNNVVYRYRNNTYLKDTEMDLHLTENKKLLDNRVYLLSTLTFSTSAALYWMKQLFITKTNPVKNGCSVSI